jgi:iron complex outermembrane receptor protein
MRNSACLFAAVSLAGLAAGVSVGAARAADASDTTTATQGSTKVGEIVITAERREENLQTTPIAVTAQTGAQLEQQGVTGFQELGLRVPSLRFGAGVTGGENVITMRGLGSQNTTPGGDSPVAYNINGVYVQRTTSIDPEFYDVDRVEVLRGPQGTLYGRNSVGGSINVITNKPTSVFEAGADALVGNYSAYTLRGYVNGPLYDQGGASVDGRLTAVYANHAGYTKNLSNVPGASHRLDAEDYFMIRGQLLARFNPDMQLLLFASYADNRDPVSPTTAWWEQPTRYITPPLGIPIGSPCDFSTAAKFQARTVCHDAPETASNKVQLYSGTFDWDLHWSHFTSLTAYGRSDVSQVSDGDGSNLPMALGTAWQLKQWQFSQELRLASPGKGEAFRWLAGFIYFYADNYENFEYQDFGFNDTFPIPGIFDEFNFISHGTTKTESFAPFGQVDYDLGKTSVGIPLTLTLGLRYTHDRKYGYNYLDYELPAACGGPCLISQGPFSTSWGQLTGKAGAEYQINDKAMAYASVSHGYLSGGNIIGLAHVYGPETLWSYEIGFKSRFLDDRVQLNIAGYHEDIKGLQVFVQSSTQSGINNVNGTTKVNGLETELVAVPIDNLRLNLTVTLTDAKYGRYITTDTRFGGPGPGCSPVAPFLCNFQGNWLNQTPPYALNFGAEYAFHTDFGVITPRVDTYFSGKVQFLPDNYFTSTQKAYHLTNFRVTWNSLDSRWRVEAFVENIENANIISNDGLQSITLGQQVIEPDNFAYYPPRTYGLRVAVKVGG